MLLVLAFDAIALLYYRPDKNMLPLSQRFFLNFPCVRKPRSGEKEKPLVTLDLNLTFMQTLGS